MLEARDRVGGRVWSRQLDNGAVVEMGAEFLLPGNTAIRDLAGRLGLGLWDKGMRYGRREPRGGIGVTRQELDDAVQAAGRALAATPPELSARRFLDELDAAPGAREALLARVEISSANTADTVAARDIGGIAHIDDDPAPSIAGGNQGDRAEARRRPGRAPGLAGGADRLARGRRAAERRRGRARCGRLRDRGARDRARPDRLRAGACPPSWRARSRRVRYGHAAKLFVPLRAPAAPSAVMSVAERYWTWTATGAGPESQPVVSAFAGSAAGAGAARGRRRAAALARLARTAAARPGAGRRRRSAVDLGRRPLGPGRLLDLTGARAGRAQRAADRPAGLRRRAPGRRLRGADGGSDPQRPGRRPRALALFISSLA